MTTTSEPQPEAARTPPASGWGWVLTGLEQVPRQRTTHQRSWDGLFTADCPCGREVNWDAFRFAPICGCPVPQRQPDPEPQG